MNAATLIRAARERRGLTQAQLAARVGAAQPMISAYENGQRDPSVETLRRLIDGTGEELFLGLVEQGGSRARPTLRSRAVSDPTTGSAGRAEALVDVLLLADAIPGRRAPDTRMSAPRLDSGRPFTPTNSERQRGPRRPTRQQGTTDADAS